MPDISMCRDRECPSRSTCYRFRAKASEYRQSYACYKHEGDRCKAYNSIDGWPEYYLAPIAEVEVEAPIDEALNELRARS